MSVELNDRLKLRPSVAVTSNLGLTEFFLSNIRKTIALQMKEDVVNLLFELDGEKTLTEWFGEKGFLAEEQSDFIQLLAYLNSNCVLIKQDELYNNDYEVYPRVFTLLEDFYSSQSEVNCAYDKIRTSFVMIIGLGSVGTWVAQSLLMSGVKNFIFVDADTVELSNLHRQCGFSEKQIGQKKVDAFSSRLKEMTGDVNIERVYDMLTHRFFKEHSFQKIDLIINCADYPTVDETSRIVGEFAMQNGIPHVIGGGYNLHQSLIGEVIMPGKTACLECFRMNLDDLNEIDTSNIKKLENKNRKIGSFPPLSALSASITTNESFKVLAGLSNLVMSNNRTEFRMQSLNFVNMEMKRRNDCKWCGYEGKYYHI